MANIDSSDFPRRESILFLLFATLLLILTYNTVLRYEYGMWDDYTLLNAARLDQTIQFTLLAANGRPLQALFSWALFEGAGNVAGLVMIRLLALLGLIAFCLLLYRGLRRQGWWALEAVAIALGICTLPAFGVHVGWATMFHGILGGLAAWLAGEAAARWSSDGGPRLLTGAVLGLLVAMSFYQPAASLYWLAVAVALFPPGRAVTGVLVRAGRAGLVFVATLAGYFATLRVVRWLYLDDPVFTGNHVRAQLTDDPLAKLDWFLREPLLLVASLGELGIQELVAGAVLGLMLAGILVYVLRSGHWQALPVWLALLPAACVSNLLVAENATFYRVLAPLSAMLFFLLVWGLQVLIAPPGPRPRALLALLLALLTLGSSYGTYRYVREHIARLHAREWATVQSVLEQHYSRWARVLVLTRPAFRHTVADLLPGLEYAMLTSSLPMGDIYQLAFAALHEDRAAPLVLICPVEQGSRQCPERVARQRLPVVDLASQLAPLRG